MATSVQEMELNKAQLHVAESKSSAMPTGALPLNSVVKVFCAHMEPDFSMPWQMQRQSYSCSSAFVISGRRLLTNAHCVLYHTQVKIEKRGVDNKFLARVLAIGRDCDLALLTVDSEEFWEGLGSHVEFGDLPSLQDSVTLVGYPKGGGTISVTRGVVSRIEVISYSDNFELLGVQIDAAINPGNSGGPAFNDKAQCVGIAFSKLGSGSYDNIGYLIPTPIITHFMKDYELNGHYTGFPTLGMETQTLDNADLRKALGIAPHLKGIRIIKVEPTSPEAEFLQPSDIILSIDGVDIANDGTVPFLHGEKIKNSYLVSAKYMGEQVNFRIFRKSVVKNFDVKLRAYNKLVPKYLEGRSPPYYITGGIVFTCVSEPYLRSEFGRDFIKSAPPSLASKYLHSMAKTEDEELVIVSQILATEISIDYDTLYYDQVISFNGTLVKNLKQMVHMVETCKEPFLRFDLEHGHVLVLDTEKAKEATPKILETHCIPFAMSKDLAA